MKGRVCIIRDIILVYHTSISYCILYIYTGILHTCIVLYQYVYWCFLLLHITWIHVIKTIARLTKQFHPMIGLAQFLNRVLEYSWETNWSIFTIWYDDQHRLSRHHHHRHSGTTTLLHANLSPAQPINQLYPVYVQLYISIVFRSIVFSHILSNILYLVILQTDSWSQSGLFVLYRYSTHSPGTNSAAWGWIW